MLKRERIFWKPVFLMILLSLILHCAVYTARQSLLQQGIADQVLRFHVLANSDSEEDQRVKYLVRDEVMQWMRETLEKEGTEKSGSSADTDFGRSEMMAFLSDHQNELTKKANEVLIEQGMPYRAAAVLETCWFPERTYGSCTFPAGCYEAMRLKLGKAEGKNWWCLLYPRLCFHDCVHAVAEDEQLAELEGILTESEYEALMKQPGGWKIRFRWFSIFD